ncbi:right-handed parallel beta-helix repeat-containing protein [Cohnella nanjingensis]|uniref:Right-handed parallel beta-helix repeat-containing protein n=1 Tax=Cohnella nanjingensis TaxID=1387779 RepID=A0A7X0RSJ8_9BACL|nr:right-handed parallel beta-helix repeat-containing protein [Cohnella nanjingensis]MBB6672929.1 right-handed parallel beta-helix repeat-containing protein [Cohnella nanjingensis]
MNETSTIINVADYGARPDSREDAGPAMRKAIEAAARATGPVVLRCEPGRYDFYPGGAERIPYPVTNTASEQEHPNIEKTIGIRFKGLRGVSLDGNGALFVYHGKMTMLVIDACDDVGIRNVRFNYERPTVAEMRVEACGDGYLDVRVHPDSRYEIEDGRLVWIGDGWRFGSGPMQICDPVADTTRRIDNFLEGDIAAEPLGPSRVRFRFGTGPMPEAGVGLVYQARDGIRDQVGALIANSRNVRWTDVGVHFAHGLGIVCQFSENVTIERLDMTPRPETGRTVAAFADCVHVSGCRGAIRIADSTFAGAHDDAINVHGTYLRIVGQSAPDEITVRFMHPQTYGFAAFFPGDRIEYVRAASLRTFGEAVVVEAESIGPREMSLKLDRPLPGDLRADDVVENVTWTPEVYVTGNRISRIPTRGVLVTTRRRTRIEGNRFERTPMSAVLVACDAGSWFESGRTEEIAVRGNTFVECGGAKHPVLAVHPEVGEGELRAASPVHARFAAEGNTFELRDGPALGARSVGSLTFSNNRIVRLGGSGGGAVAIELDACGIAEIAGNRLEGEARAGTIAVRRMKPERVSLEAGQRLEAAYDKAEAE